MNILIVDDEKYILDSIIQNVKWERLPFDNRFLAHNGEEARKVLMNIPVQVLLCDIEMPKESGLELLEWMRESGMKTIAVFLTSYAEFDYAQKAVQLGSFDYFLKPIQYDKLTDILAKAAERAEEEETARRDQQYGQNWVESEKNRKETFWTQILTGHETYTMEEINYQMEKYGLAYAADQRFILMAIRLEGRVQTDWRDDSMISYKLSSTYYECLPEDVDAPIEALWKDSSNIWFAVVSVTGQGQELWKTVGGAVSHMRRKLSRNYREFAVYLSEDSYVADIRGRMRQVQEMLFSNILYVQGVFFAGEYLPEKAPDIQMDVRALEEYFLREDEEWLRGYIGRLCSTLKREERVSQMALQKALLEWIRIVFVYLQKNQVEAYLLFENEEYKRLYEQAGYSLEKFREYLYYIVEKSIEYGKQARESDTIIEQIDRYIDDHLADNLTRNSFSEVVYLNPVYLAELFRRAKGISIKRYVNQRRLEKAAELLLSTEENVYNIALKVGYPTSSYFSRKFREYYGVGPAEYRQNTKK